LQITQITGSEYRLYLIGSVTYEDAFGEPRLTEFACILGGERLKYSMLHPNPDGWADAYFEFAPFHNHAT
jgi:hypothetical protein